jgi:hypothetical protein
VGAWRGSTATACIALHAAPATRPSTCMMHGIGVLRDGLHTGESWRHEE